MIMATWMDSGSGGGFRTAAVCTVCTSHSVLSHRSAQPLGGGCPAGLVRHVGNGWSAWSELVGGYVTCPGNGNQVCVNWSVRSRRTDRVLRPRCRSRGRRSRSAREMVWSFMVWERCCVLGSVGFHLHLLGTLGRSRHCSCALDTGRAGLVVNCPASWCIQPLPFQACIRDAGWGGGLSFPERMHLSSARVTRQGGRSSNSAAFCSRRVMSDIEEDDGVARRLCAPPFQASLLFVFRLFYS